ncbi:MAG: hypothetical protein K6T73_03290 [Candidatus Bathyarchaeota archaeon]|nr:hypothetical protein [Candidatus Bathyarchaeota archaeon]
MAEKEKYECYEMVRRDFLDMTTDFIKIGGEFPLKSALDNLHAIARIDTRLIAMGYIDLPSLSKRRIETENLIETVKRKLGEL